MNFDSIWSNFLSEMKIELSSLAYKTWFEETKLLKIDNQKAYIIVPMPIHKKHLSDNYKELITEKLNTITGSFCELFFLLSEEADEILREETTDNNDNDSSKESEIIDIATQTNLNPLYTFDNFVVGNSNKFAHAAALSVAENPGKMYNPLFLYGESRNPLSKTDCLFYRSRIQRSL